MFSHDFIEKPQRFSVHMEKLSEEGGRPDLAHVGKDVPVQQRVAIAEIAQINPEILTYETSMALVTFCFGSVFGMVTVRMPSSTLAEIWSFTTSSGSV